MKKTLLIPALCFVGAVALTSCGNDATSDPSSQGIEEQDHSGHAEPTNRATSPGQVDDTDDTGIPDTPTGVHFPADPTGCAWYQDVAGATVCVPDPLPDNVTGKKACDYLRDQGYGPLHVSVGNGRGSVDDPLKLDDNGDGIACYAGDFGTAEAPPDASGGGIVPATSND